MLTKIWRVLRKEGVTGLAMRLYHPKHNISATALTPPFPLPLRLEGDRGGLADTLTAALTLLAGHDAVQSDEFKGRLHLSPAREGADFGPQDAILFDTSESVATFIDTNDKAGSKLTRAITNCAALLLPSAEYLDQFEEAGIARGKIFVVPMPADFRHDNVTSLAGALARWLIAAGTLSAEDIDPDLFTVLHDLVPGSRLCLSLPETPARRSNFLRLGMNDFQIFNGIRKIPGWQGCGWSYATIARAALRHDAVPLTVCEDDVVPGEDFPARLNEVEAYLQNEEWDLFSGILTDVPENCRIHRVERKGALTFIHLDYSIGMVMNIYNRRALERLAIWQPDNGDIEHNTIDVWLGATPGLHVITTLPFLAGHNLDARSTIFGFANKRYDSMIRASERRLEKLIARL